MIYTDDFARELLSAALIPEKNKQYNYKKNSGKILYYYIGEYIKNNKITDRIKIKKGGGIGLPVKGGEQNVDVLLYSKKTKTYEILRATYNKFDDELYIDIRKYREFVKKYGMPGFEIYIDNNYHKYGYIDFCEMNDESILMIYGYSSKLPKSSREEILAEIIDLGILKPIDIINYLEFFIRSHSDIKYSANCREWEKDIKFVEKYKANPQRFLIANC